MTSFLVISYVCGIAAVIDIYRRPYTEWQHADRDRFHWGLWGIFTTMITLGVFFAAFYLFLVVGRFGGPPAANDPRGFGRNDFSK